MLGSDTPQTTISHKGNLAGINQYADETNENISVEVTITLNGVLVR